MKKSYNEKDYKTFTELRDECSLPCFDNYKRNIARLNMSEFLKRFTRATGVKMFERDNKEHNC